MNVYKCHRRHEAMSKPALADGDIEQRHFACTADDGAVISFRQKHAPSAASQAVGSTARLPIRPQPPSRPRRNCVGAAAGRAGLAAENAACQSSKASTP